MIERKAFADLLRIFKLFSFQTRKLGLPILWQKTTTTTTWHLMELEPSMRKEGSQRKWML